MTDRYFRPVTLFDLDGTLVDTQNAETLALLHFARTVHSRISSDDLTPLVAGRRIQDSIDIIRSYGSDAMPPDAVMTIRELTEEYLTGRLRTMPGVARALIDITGEKYVVSNSPLDIIVDRLAQTKLLSHFTGPHFSAYELRSWKPEPGIYLGALERLQVDPLCAVAVEDSEVGVQAAREAGIRVCWYRPGEPTAASWSSMVRVFGDMAALPHILDEAHRRARRRDTRQETSRWADDQRSAKSSISMW